MTTWFDTARFGMFVHWGHSSQQGIELSWPLVGGVAAIPEVAERARRPVPRLRGHLQSDEVGPGRAREAREGAAACSTPSSRPSTTTATRCSTRSTRSTRSSTRRTAATSSASFVDALRAEGLRVGAYFSLIDWYHPDYPRFREEDKPYGILGQWPRPEPDAWERFIEFMFGQVRELLTNYGAIDVIWFDGGWERSMAQWRVEGAGAHDPLAAAGHPHQRPPARRRRLRHARAVRARAQPPERAWETCMTMNESWAYNPVRHEVEVTAPPHPHAVRSRRHAAATCS